MGWFSKKKKIPKVPLPAGHPVDENALRFPSMPHSERVIEPDHVKQAVGVGNDKSLPPLPEYPKMSPPAAPRRKVAKRQPTAPAMAPPIPRVAGHPLYAKVDVYQRVLGELDSLRTDISHLSTANNHLAKSEFNEEKNFEKLKRNVRNMHDRLLLVDKVLFKTQGE